MENVKIFKPQSFQQAKCLLCILQNIRTSYGYLVIWHDSLHLWYPLNLKYEVSHESCSFLFGLYGSMDYDNFHPSLSRTVYARFLVASACFLFLLVPSDFQFFHLGFIQAAELKEKQRKTYYFFLCVQSY